MQASVSTIFKKNHLHQANYFYGDQYQFLTRDFQYCLSRKRYRLRIVLTERFQHFQVFRTILENNLLIFWLHSVPRLQL